MNTCTTACWTETICLVCEHAQPPIGRSVALEAASGYCDCDCPGWVDNRRHLWSIHDAVRKYTDPVGWATHVAICEQCRDYWGHG